MKNSLKIGFLLGFVFMLSQAYSADQVGPIKDGNKTVEPSDDQIEPNLKSSNENNGVVFSAQKKTSTASSKTPELSEEYIRKFSAIILNSFREKFVNTKRESFFLLPFSIEL
ncbi:MAG: hypothetical protein KDC84_07445 [Crocinitomicaceae bacterium]|nr:hypothetical protein [Crocinitomicaceae bacterium]